MSRARSGTVFGCAALWVCAAWGQTVPLGAAVEPFTLQDLEGQQVASGALRGAVTVVTFVSVQCPMSNAYNDRMSALFRDYGGKGVHFFFVNANRTETAREVAEHSRAVGFPFPVYKDAGNRLADRFGAEVTPTSYVIDREGKLVYRGQIDDNRNEARMEQRTLRMALDAALAGKRVPVAETKAFGCTIKRERKRS